MFFYFPFFSQNSPLAAHCGMGVKKNLHKQVLASSRPQIIISSCFVQFLWPASSKTWPVIRNSWAMALVQVWAFSYFQLFPVQSDVSMHPANLFSSLCQTLFNYCRFEFLLYTSGAFRWKKTSVEVFSFQFYSALWGPEMNQCYICYLF